MLTKQDENDRLLASHCEMEKRLEAQTLRLQQTEAMLITEKQTNNRETALINMYKDHIKQLELSESTLKTELMKKQMDAEVFEQHFLELNSELLEKKRDLESCQVTTTIFDM